MNINSSSLQSLLSVDSLESMQHSLQADGTASPEFSDMLMDKITQLKGLSEDGHSVDNLDVLQGLAGFQELFGNGLPLGHKLTQDVDLETTLAALENVLEKLEYGDLQSEIDAMLEKVASLKSSLSGQGDLNDQLEKITDDLQQMKTRLLSDEETDIEDQIVLLETEIDSIVESFANKFANKLSDKNKSLTEQNELDESLVLTEEEKDSLQITSQLTTLSASTNDPVERDKSTFSTLTTQELRPEIKKESTAIKQMAEEASLGMTGKKEAEGLLQQENSSHKPGQEELLYMSKKIEKTAGFNLNDFDLSTEKSLPKFATDIANLNRAVAVENKAEIPTMTKHFAHPEWNKEMGERVLWMHKQAIPSAELRLNPAHLGPITIKIDITQDQATVAFTAQHMAVKEAIEAALPKLKEMFSAQQLNLLDVNVSQDDSGQRQQKAFSQMGNGSGEAKNNENGEMVDSEQVETTMDIAEEIAAGRAIASNGVLSLFA